MMQALTPIPFTSCCASENLHEVSQKPFCESSGTPEISTSTTRSDLELDCLNQNEISTSSFVPEKDRAFGSDFDKGHQDVSQCTTELEHSSSESTGSQNIVRYGDVGLLFSLGSSSSNVSSFADSRRTSSEEFSADVRTGGTPVPYDNDDEALAFLFKYTHVVGAS
jgi:hypothetical protein